MGLNTIDFYYFSGTGNTQLVVKKMRDIFVEKGINVNLYRLEKAVPQDINLNHTLGLGFPVAAQSTYPFVWDFVNRLPDTDGTEIFMVDTLAVYSGAIVGPLKRVLNKKGYKTIGAKEIIMPSNFYPKNIDENKNKIKIDKGLEKAKKYALDIINGRAKWRRVPVLSDMFYFLVSRKMVWRMVADWGKRFKIDRERCTKCGLCVRLCPVNNVRMNEYPWFSDKCQQCLRCISFCPTGAIYIPEKKYKTYRAISIGELLKDE
ncbi:4Fe-4S ferredoxin [Anoxybacter fermentans]|uniref:Ferredoxin n=1 Tax=Anoxybacter fermentans TaxID=1323375 RepID=A0A3Q9HS52_9FIRM|nr:EFR1 family ferrodoxin [Anoxybacter fermentans]AZR74534.1 4Fe-4S ferredoxin [Anoxybacter fermentans]